MTDTRLLYSRPEAAAQLSISERVLDRLIAEGQIETAAIGRRKLVPHDCLVEYIERLRRSA